MDGQDNRKGHDFEGFESIPLRVNVKVGAAKRTLARLVALKQGDVIELDRRIGEPFELLAHGRLLGLVEPVATPGNPRRSKDGADDAGKSRATGGDSVAVKLVEVPEDDDVPGR